MEGRRDVIEVTKGQSPPLVPKMNAYINVRYHANDIEMILSRFCKQGDKMILTAVILEARRMSYVNEKNKFKKKKNPNLGVYTSDNIRDGCHSG